MHHHKSSEICVVYLITHLLMRNRLSPRQRLDLLTLSLILMYSCSWRDPEPTKSLGKIKCGNVNLVFSDQN